MSQYCKLEDAKIVALYYGIDENHNPTDEVLWCKDIQQLAEYDFIQKQRGYDFHIFELKKIDKSLFNTVAKSLQSEKEKSEKKQRIIYLKAELHELENE